MITKKKNLTLSTINKFIQKARHRQRSLLLLLNIRKNINSIKHSKDRKIKNTLHLLIVFIINKINRRDKKRGKHQSLHLPPNQNHSHHLQSLRLNRVSKAIQKTDQKMPDTINFLSEKKLKIIKFFGT